MTLFQDNESIGSVDSRYQATSAANNMYHKLYRKVARSVRASKLWHEDTAHVSLSPSSTHQPTLNTDTVHPSQVALNTGSSRCKKRCLLPWYCAALPWALVVACCCTCGFFTVIYTLNFGLNKSLRWLQSFVMSIAVDVLLAQPCKVLLLAAFYTLVLRRSDMESFQLPQAVAASDEDDVFESALNPEQMRKLSSYKETAEIYKPPLEVTSWSSLGVCIVITRDVHGHHSRFA